MILFVATHKRSEGAQSKRAAATRQKLISTARGMFIRDGYNATTMARIAEQAGVAVQTVYFVFHTKGHVLNQVFEAAVLGGSDPTPPEQSSWYHQATTTDGGGGEAVATFVRGAADILRRTAPLEAVIQTARHTEGAVQASHEHGERLRVEGYGRFVHSLESRGLLSPSADAKESTDVLLTLLGPATYSTLTRDRGWKHTQEPAGWRAPEQHHHEGGRLRPNRRIQPRRVEVHAAPDPGRGT